MEQDDVERVNVKLVLNVWSWTKAQNFSTAFTAMCAHHGYKRMGERERQYKAGRGIARAGKGGRDRERVRK